MGPYRNRVALITGRLADLDAASPAGIVKALERSGAEAAVER